MHMPAKTLFRTRSYKHYVLNEITPGKKIVIADAETTGLDKFAEIIQFSAVKVLVKDDLSLEEIDRINTYIKPTVLVSPKITNLTGITNEMLNDKDTEDIIFPLIDAFLHNADGIVGHNVKFDILKIKGMYFRQGYFLKDIPVYDTLEMSRDFEPKVSHKLSDIATMYGFDAGLDFHNSEDDVTATKRLFEYFIKSYSSIKEWTGTTKPRIGYINYMEMPNHKENRIYVNTSDGTVYFNVHYRVWGAKEGTDMTLLDMEYIQQTVLNLLGLKSTDELAKYRSEYSYQKEKK